MQPGLRAPGVSLQIDVPASVPALPTGVPLFLGYARGGPLLVPTPLRVRDQFAALFGASLGADRDAGFPLGGFLAEAVAAFFDNGGDYCVVVRLPADAPPLAALQAGLDAAETVAEVDLVCAPDIVAYGAASPLAEQVALILAQQALLARSCDAGLHRVALLDPLRAADASAVVAQRAALQATNAALYFPWVRTAGGGGRAMPPCGHVAGVIARTDRVAGVHKAPANAVLEGVVDLAVLLDDAAQAALNPLGINALRAFPGRGIRIWGARTLSHDPDWTYLSTRRFFLTTCRWIEANLTALPFEPNDATLQSRIVRLLSAYFASAWQRGALPGATARDAFYVRCDAAANPPEVRRAGRIVAEIGIAPEIPLEFINARIVVGESGAALAPAPG